MLKPPQAIGAAQSERPGKKTLGGADQVGATSAGHQSFPGTAAGSPNPPPCKSPTFKLDQYGDSRTGELTWAGVLLARGQLDIQGKQTSLDYLRGDTLPKGIPVRVSVSPETVRLTAAPAARNCWNSPLVLENTAPGAASEIRVKWEVFQP